MITIDLQGALNAILGESLKKEFLGVILVFFWRRDPANGKFHLEMFLIYFAMVFIQKLCKCHNANIS